MSAKHIPPKKKKAAKSADNFVTVYGFHVVREALIQKPVCVTRVIASEERLTALGPKVLKGCKDIELLDPIHPPKGIDRHVVHQDTAAIIDTRKLMVPFSEYIASFVPGDDSAFVLCAEVQDPHNLGAVIRASAAFGVHAVGIPRYDQAQFSASVAKVSAGMAFRLPLVDVPNVNQSIEKFKEKGYFIYGLDSEGTARLDETQFDRPTVFVLGNEGYGLRKKTREHCDEILSIQMHPRAESLNAAAATSVALYAWSVQHLSALK